MTFRGQGIEPADGFAGHGFIVRPVLPSDNELDHAAVMETREFLYHWEQDPPYPPADFSTEDNLADLEQMRAAHLDGSRYSYTVMNSDESLCLGCIYLLPNNDRMYRSAEVTSHDGTDFSSIDMTMSLWVRTSTWESGIEATLLRATLDWLRHNWQITRPVFLTNEHLDQQIATCESLGLTRRFDYDRERDMYTTYAYA